jgi:hypothetical protein
MGKGGSFEDQKKLTGLGGSADLHFGFLKGLAGGFFGEAAGFCDAANGAFRHGGKGWGRVDGAGLRSVDGLC